ncbi:MAG: SPOR domain-containing protein [Gilvibacter sp.]
MQLDAYIQELLYRYECVILPGFGAFLSQYSPAAINAQSGQFVPPSKQVIFNAQLQSNDGLLANHIAQVDESSYQEALQKIRKYTRFLFHELEEGKNVSIAQVGGFSLDQAQALQFEPSKHINYNTDSFGLEAIQPAMVAREVVIEQPVTEADKTPVIALASQATTRPYLRYAAIGLLAVGLTGFGGVKIYESGVKQHNLVQKQEADSRIESQIQEATFVIANPLPSLELEIPTVTGRYHIIAGAFRMEANAHKKIAQLQELGFNARLIGQNKYGLHQVTYTSLEQRTDALRELRHIKSAFNKDAWLLVKTVD